MSTYNYEEFPVPSKFRDELLAQLELPAGQLSLDDLVEVIEVVDDTDIHN